MKKLIYLPLIAFLVFAYSAFSSDNSFVKGQRSEADLNRDKLSKGHDVVALVDLKEGMVVADVLGGGGYYSEIISNVVGDTGKVFLHNNKAYMPYVEKQLAARLAEGRLSNVIRHDKEADNLQLSASSLDAVFFVLGYHDLYHKVEGWDIDKDSFIKQIANGLKQGGKLLVVDHSAVGGSKTKHSQELHRIDKQYVIDELKSYGFNLVKQSELLANDKDSRMISPFKPEIRRKTDRFILVFEKV